MPDWSLPRMGELRGGIARNPLGQHSQPPTLRSGVVWLLLSQFLTPVLQFGQLIVLTLYLTPQDLGSWALPVAIFGIAAIIFEVALPAAVVSQRRMDSSLATRWGLTIGLLIALISLLGWATGTRGSLILLGMVPVIALLARNVQSRAQLTINRRFPTLAWTELFSACVSVLVAISCGAGGLGPWSLLVALLVRQAMITSLQSSAAKKMDGLRPGSIAGCSLVWFYGVNYLGLNLDYLYAGRELAIGDAGIYFVAFNVSTVVALKVITVANRVALPTLTDSTVPHERYRAFLWIASTGVLAVTAVAAAVVSVLEWRVLGSWADLEVPVGWLLVGSVGLAMSTVCSTIVIARSRRGLLSGLAMTDVAISITVLTWISPSSADDLARTMALLLTTRGVLWSLATMVIARVPGLAQSMARCLALWCGCCVLLAPGVVTAPSAAAIGGGALWIMRASLIRRRSLTLEGDSA